MSRTNRVPEIADETDTEKLLRQLQQATEATLEPTEPEEALELYVEDKARECRKSTVASHRSRLGFFVDWCAEQGIDNLNNLSARDLHEYRVWRREDLSVNTEKTQMDTLRVFVEWCETIDAVPSGLFKKIKSPSIPDEEAARETTLHVSDAKEIVEYLRRFEYASIEHVAWVLLTETGMRMGAARTLDVGDYRPDADKPHLDVVHRPETDTPIKNGPRGERRVGISDDVCAVVDDYLEHQRPVVTDDYGREPLLATVQGRIAKSTIRRYVYKRSRPCTIGRECPHDRDPDECEAAVDPDHASGCPSSVTPHPIRRGYITYLLQAGVPVDVISDRCNVSPKVIELHYDVRSEEDKMRQRREVLDEILRDGSGDR
ncbi:tyrosine-type recombinase/integrase [Haloterrigena alkaliphila]|uniref:Site-specific integrase n=1 Tax=Haloterrigena alkaliphila TaxID=2816475 RepID=A0A8A2VK62_9EURY|nr:site-specific integrase [Haloterrigena alkaliphila]QSX01008.1 site-specific integrase [Haloterrigena alkaliphila]